MGKIEIKKELNNLEGKTVEVINSGKWIEGVLEFHPETRRKEYFSYPKRTKCLKPGYYIKKENGEIKINIKDIYEITGNLIRLAFLEPVTCTGVEND